MRRVRMATALAVAILAGQAGSGWAQEGFPPVPTKSLPVRATTLSGTNDVEVVRTMQETAVEDTETNQLLDELAWMVGDWVDDDEDATIESTVGWTKGGSFLRRTFHVTRKSGETHAGLQLIGWDPAEKAIRSWIYDEDGGFGEERWKRVGDRWTIRSKYTLPDGGRASATHVMRKVDDNAYTWKSGNRLIGSTPQPDIDEVTVVRRSTETPATHEEVAPGTAKEIQR